MFRFVHSDERTQVRIMTEYADLFSNQLIFLDLEMSDFAALCHNISERLLKLDLVTANYEQALWQREQQFPTGIKTPYITLSLPHTKPQHINHSFITLVRTKNPILMQQMDQQFVIPVQNFFFLGISDKMPSLHSQLLKRFLQLSNNPDFVNDFLYINNINDLYDYLLNTF